MGKDRVKDILKHVLARRATRWLYDYNENIRDPIFGATLGRCREVFSFVDGNRVPKHVHAKRHEDAKTLIEAESKPEVVMHYGKQISLSNRVINRTHGRLHDVNDIIRFNVASFLPRMDDPGQCVRTFSVEHDGVIDDEPEGPHRETDGKAVQHEQAGDDGDDRADRGREHRLLDERDDDGEPAVAEHLEGGELPHP